MSIGRLVIVSFQDPRHINGGVQRRVAEEIAYFTKHGMKIDVIVAGSGVASISGPVRYIMVPTPRVIYPLRLLFFAAGAARHLRNYPAFDVVEMHDDGGTALLLAYPFRRLPHGVFISVAHGVFRDEFAAICRYEGLSRSTLIASGFLPISLAEQMATRRATAVVAVSEYVAQQIARQYGVPRGRIHVISNGIDTRLFMPSARTQVRENNAPRLLLYVGRLHIRKGILQLLRAFNVARSTNPMLRLRLVGGGPLEAAARRECEQLGLSEVVEFAGMLAGNELVEAYRSADIVCIPSLQEGQGIVALEAQACAKPVIATRAGGLAEVVRDRLTGLLVPPGDVAALSEAILELSSSSALQQEFGHNAAEWVRSFAWENVLAQQLALYENLLAAREAEPQD